MAALWPYLAILVLIACLFLIERRWPEAVTRFEENVLAILLATITIVSFVQVIARYGFNTGWSGALEFNRILFAWIILFGMSYGLKTGLHLGVDAAILLNADWLRIFGADSSGGAVFYWQRFFQIGLGLDDLRYPEWMQEAFGIQERVQRWIAYLILPVGLALLGFRAIQAMVDIATGRRELVIAGHEAEDLVAENKDVLKD